MGNVNGKERLSAGHLGDSSSNNSSSSNHQHHQHHHHNNNKSRASDPVGSINIGSSRNGSSDTPQSSDRPRLGRQRSRTTSGTHSTNPFLRLGSRNNHSSSHDNISSGDGDHHQHKDSQNRKSSSPPLSKPAIDPRVLVDGGYLVPQGVYKGEPDYDIEVVRDLQLTRRLAPFFKPLNDYDDTWTDRQLFAAIHGLTINQSSASSSSSSSAGDKNQQLKDLKNDNVAELRKPRNRASTLNGHDTGRQRDQNHSQLMIYRGSQECPICFMYYPPFLNATRCCAQPICSECFVQIKRPEPHAPHNNNEGGNNQQHSPSSPSVDPASTATSMSSLANDQEFLSEPACCPFCTATDFGIVYSAPIYVNTGVIRAPMPNSPHDLVPPESGVSLTEASLKSPVSSGSFDTTVSGGGGRPRRLSLPPIHDQVVTTDKIRPNWALKLASARAHAARRSFAASALHSSVFLSSSPDVSSESVGGRFGSSARALVGGNRQHSHNHGRLRQHKNGRKHRLAVLDQEEAELTEAISQSLIEEEARKLQEKYANDPMCSPRTSSSPTRFQQPSLPETPVDSQEETVKSSSQHHQNSKTALSHEALKSSDSIFSMHHMGNEQTARV